MTEVGLEVAEVADVPDSFLADETEGAAYYRAIRGSMPGFDMRFLAVFRSGQQVALVPYFLTVFRLDTMLGDTGRFAVIASKIGFRIACIGNPTVAVGRVHGELSGEVVDAVFRHLRTQAPLVSFKGFASDLPASGFARAAGLPLATVEFDEATWLEMRSKRNISRKLKQSAALHHEIHLGWPETHADTIYQLYLNTYERARYKFGKLGRAYFEATSPSSVYSLTFLGDRLVGFAQIIRRGEHGVANFMGMDYLIDEKIGLYFAIVIRIMDSAKQLGLRRIDLGETSYTFKKRIGCSLQETWIYYRHRNPLLNLALARLGFLLEPSLEDLA